MSILIYFKEYSDELRVGSKIFGQFVHEHKTLWEIISIGCIREIKNILKSGFNNIYSTFSKTKCQKLESTLQNGQIKINTVNV